MCNTSQTRFENMSKMRKLFLVLKVYENQQIKRNDISLLFNKKKENKIKEHESSMVDNTANLVALIPLFPTT